MVDQQSQSDTVVGGSLQNSTLGVPVGARPSPLKIRLSRCSESRGPAQPPGSGRTQGTGLSPPPDSARERIESAVQDEQEEIARLQREIEDLNRSLGPPAEPTGGE